MGKAARTKRRKVKGQLVFPGFPYEREFSQAELDVVFARWDRLKEVLRDPVGPQGWGLGMSEDFMQQLALHLAFALPDVGPAGYPSFDPATGIGSFIRPVRNPDGLHVDSQRWVLTKHDKPGDRARDVKAEAAARIKAMREAAMRGVPDDVREAMNEMFVAGTEWAEDENRPAVDPEPLAQGREEETEP